MNIVVASGGQSAIIREAIKLTGKKNVRMLFIPTAQGDGIGEAQSVYDEHRRVIEEPSVLHLYRRTVRDFKEFLKPFDIAYVCSGNTVHMCGLWYAHGLNEPLREAAENGMVLCGSSAGALCWFKHGVTDSLGPGLNPFEAGLGFVPGSFTPHASFGRRRVFQDYVKKSGISGYALGDQSGLHFENGKLKTVFNCADYSDAWRVTPEGETSLPGKRIGEYRVPSFRIPKAGRVPQE